MKKTQKLFAFLICTIISFSNYSFAQCANNNDSNFLYKTIYFESEINYDDIINFCTLFNTQTEASQTEYRLKEKYTILPTDNTNIKLIANEKNAATSYEGEKYDEAIQIYTLLINDNKKNPDLYYKRGLAYLANGNLKKADKDFSKAVRINPSYAKAYDARGYIKNQKEKYDCAISDFKKAIKADSNFADAYYNRGVSYLSLKKYSKAVSDFSKAIEINPENWHYYMNRGVAKDKLEAYTGALEDYTKAIRLKPDYAPLYNNMGIAKEKIGLKRSALADYNKAIELDSAFSSAYYSRGYLQYKANNYKDAIKDVNYAKNISINENDDIMIKNCTELSDKIKKDRIKYVF